MRAVVKWSCYVTTIKCHIPNCDEEESVEHLLVDCQRSKLVWGKMSQELGLKINVNYKAVMYGVFDEKMTVLEQDFYWLIICTVVNKLWRTRCMMVIHQETIPGEVVFKQIRTELKRQRTLDTRKKKLTPWHLLEL